MQGQHDAATSREEVVRAAVNRWASDLIDLSRRNPLLHFHDHATSTLDLGQADAGERTRLLDGAKVRATSLFPDDEGLRRARRNLGAIRARLRTLKEERGIDAGHVATGLASWPVPQPSGSSIPCRSPILLHPLTIAARGRGGQDFDLEVDGPALVNPVLVHALSRLSAVNMAGLDHGPDDAHLIPPLPDVVSQLMDRGRAAGVALAVEDKTTVGAFAYEKLPMVRDLEASVPHLTSHPLIAALAGDPAARQAIQFRRAPEENKVNAIRPQDERLVLDADSSQQQAIAAAINGHDLVVKGPPGTGKSQTIANLIAEATARGQTVLFVAQKRAAINAVVENLRECDLDGLVLDLHDPKTGRRAVLDQLQVSMERAGSERAPNVSELHRRLADRRAQLARRSEALREVRQPYGVSIAQLHELWARCEVDGDRDLLLPRRCIDSVSHDKLENLTETLSLFVERGGLSFWRRESAWSDARGVTDQADLPAIRERLVGLTGSRVDDTRRTLERLLKTTGLPRPANVAEWAEVLDLLSGVSKSVAAYGPDVFDGDLVHRQAAMADRAWRREHEVSLSFLQRRTLAKSVRSRRSTPAPREVMFDELSAAVAQRARWSSLTGGRLPRAADGLDVAVSRYAELTADLATIGAITAVGDLDRRRTPEMDAHLRRLRDDDTLDRLPELNRARADFETLGLSELITRLAAANRSPAEAASTLRAAWVTSVLKSLRSSVPEYATFTAAAQDRTIGEFRTADQEHVAAAAARVRRASAERQVQARDQHRDQLALVREQVHRKRPNKSIRRLVDEAPDLLLAVRPCWAMSPLAVSQVLPARALFDLVVFDEASQIEPADAIAAIARGRHVVVAGDAKQLPPTPFFATAREDDDDDEDAARLDGYDSILDRLSADLSETTLTWHYRSNDDRLIAFPNRAIYRDELVTFPSTVRESPLRHIVVPGATPIGSKGLVPAEADRVVALVLDHARYRPEETLGVITLGVSAAKRIQAQLDLVRLEHPDLEPFFDDNGHAGREFFIKSIESVQGDERDAIILSVGGTRTASGTLNHRFGPINQQGGERRLNVAVTRAKKSMTVVSSFAHHELEDDKIRGEGLRFLRGYLRFAAEQGRDNHSAAEGGSALENRVREQLESAGLRVHQRYGASQTKIALAVEDLTRPGQLALAVEIDDEDYHDTARSIRDRDRLRPDQLARMGWRHHRVWASEWLLDPEAQLQELVAASTSAPTAPTADPPPSPAPLNETPPSPIPPRQATRSGPRPVGLQPGLSISEYSHAALVRLAAWIDSDELLRDRDEMVAVMMTELDFRRRGKNIIAALERAVTEVRSSRGA